MKEKTFVTKSKISGAQFHFMGDQPTHASPQNWKIEKLNAERKKSKKGFKWQRMDQIHKILALKSETQNSQSWCYGMKVLFNNAIQCLIFTEQSLLSIPLSIKLIHMRTMSPMISILVQRFFRFVCTPNHSMVNESKIEINCLKHKMYKMVRCVCMCLWCEHVFLWL